jgi:hypothetical protein
MPEIVKAKFRCIEKAERASQYGTAGSVNGSVVKLAAVAGDENKEWSRYTPWGNLEMQIDNPAAMDQFVVGKDYILTFEKCEG